MSKPRWAFVGITLLGTAGVTGALVVASSGGEEEVVQQVATMEATATASAIEPSALTPSSSTRTEAPSPTPYRTAGPGETLWRWVNVTVLVPNDSGIEVARQLPTPQFEDGGPIVSMVRRHPDLNIDSEARIDADTGEVLAKFVAETDAPFIDGVLATIRVGEPLSGEPLPWPYGPASPSKPKVEVQGLRYWEPDPASGLLSTLACGDAVSGDGSGCGIVLYDIRSAVRAEIQMGRLVISARDVKSEDEEAFGRWSAAVEFVGP